MVYPKGKANVPLKRRVKEKLERIGGAARQANESIFQVWERGVSNFDGSPSVFVLPY